MASSDSDPNSERHHPLVLGLGARRRAPKDGNARHAAAPHTRHRGSGQQRSMATPRAAARTPASAANPPSNTNCTKRPGQKPHKQTVNNLRTTPLPENSHVISLGQFSRCPENVGIATVGFQSLNNGEGNYVRHLWGTMRVCGVQVCGDLASGPGPTQGLHPVAPGEVVFELFEGHPARLRHDE